ncbi:hypothetical protein DP116_14980 [Brasilonema bromeliae SPC951]|uniref:Uncharacterized protein n=1 Tax=Brasilonema bromeliae SPC951 TaxID=385972 RepID=A0ABX1PA71_9CYAN|nr:hypothetical protein [Brasilonema bromeliae SPC951]
MRNLTSNNVKFFHPLTFFLFFFFRDVNVNKKIQIIGEHHVNMDDERGSGRFCLEMLTANQYFFAAISVLFTNHFGISALVAEFFQKMWVQTPLSDTSNMGLISI